MSNLRDFSSEAYDELCQVIDTSIGEYQFGDFFKHIFSSEINFDKYTGSISEYYKSIVRDHYRFWMEDTASEYVSQYIPGVELSYKEQTMNNINQLIKKYDDENFELNLDYKIAAQNRAFGVQLYNDKIHRGVPLDEINLSYRLKQYEEESGVKITYDEVIEALSAEVNEYGESIVELDNNEKLWNYVLWYFAKDL